MVVIDLGYRKVIVPKEQAMVLIEALEHADVYEEKYWSEDKRKERGMTESYTYHVYANEAHFGMRIVSESHYQMAKLAGKPQEK